MKHQISARSEAKSILLGVVLGLKEIFIPPKIVKPSWCRCILCGGWHYAAKK